MSDNIKKFGVERKNTSLPSAIIENGTYLYLAAHNMQQLERVHKTTAEVDDIPEFFKNCTVFITGVTGFLGHVLLAKLLSSCPDVKKIFVLMREKRNQSIDARLQNMLNGQVFEKARIQCPNLSNKITIIRGDCRKANLGISEDDREILQTEVNVVFHVAATVNFDAPLKEAVYINVRSTRDFLEIAKHMKHLQAFVHVSTAFSFCPNRNVIEEKLYKPPVTASNLIQMMDILDDEIVEKITPTLLNSYPNTYVFTKAVTEGLFNSKSLNLPAIIFRPAIVVSTAEEPIRGWINNVYGPTGIVAAAGVGLLRSLQVNKKCLANIVPCDYVVNAMIASAWFAAKRHELSNNNLPSKLGDLVSEDVSVFNYSSSELKDAITWERFIYEYEDLEHQIPFSSSMWKHIFIANKYKFKHQIMIVFLHLLPAFIIDRFAIIIGKKPRLLNTYRKIHKLCNVLSFFTVREWKIPNDRVQYLWSILSESDRQKFYFNLDNLNWKKYFWDHFVGIREYVVKDKLDTLPYAKRRRKVLIVIHYILLLILVGSGMIFVATVYSLLFR